MFHRRAVCALACLPSIRVAALALVLGCLSATPAWAQMQIMFDGSTTITDGGAGDLDFLTNGKIDFSGIYGNAGYQVSGTLRESPPWAVGPTISQQLAAPIYSLTLTNFVAEALGTSILNTTMALRFNSDPFAGFHPAGTAIDSLVAEVGSATNSPIPAGTDSVITLMSIIADTSGTQITPPTGAPLPMGNPFHPGPGTTPYPVTGNGPTLTPPFVNPVIYGLVEFELGGVGNQLLMPSSLEIGFSPVPEPSTVSLLVVGVACLGGAAYRRRRAAGKS